MLTIDINHKNNQYYYCLAGSLDEITSNRRLVTSFNRLNYSIVGGSLIIPTSEKEQISQLQEIQRLLEKFSLTYTLSENISSELVSFSREQQQFDEFSKHANLIKNNKFDEYPELISDFDEFQKVVKAKFSKNRSLYPLQLLSAFHLAFSQNSCNFAVPGAGKTSIVYAAFAYLSSLPKEHPKHVDKLMVIGPLSSFAPWEKEYKECFGREGSYKRLSGDLTIRKDEKLQHLYAANPSEVTLIFHGGVDSLQTDIINFLKQNKTMLVVDEAHRIKNPEGVWGQSIAEVSKEARARVILTGTPLPNGFQDIYNLYKFIYPYKYKDIIHFHYQNLIDMTNGGDLDNPRITQLKNNLSPFFIRIKKQDLKLPPINEVIQTIQMNERQREIYDFIESNYIKSFKAKSTANVQDFVNKAKLIRLRQAASNPALLAKPLINAMESNDFKGEFDPNSKYTTHDELFIDDTDFFNQIINYDILETPQKYVNAYNLIKSEIIPKNEKIIIWTIFIQNAKALETYLNKNGINTKLLIGEVEQAEREVIIDQFNNPESLEFQVVIANPFAVAESISLHKGCHNALYLERDYNCSNFIQSKDRIHRVGLDENQLTTYYYFVCKDSIDEVIHTKLLAKIERMDKIINDDIPLFSRINESDETDIIKELIANYARRT
jgi:SNF2 family DNA or RNA helicase